VNEKNVKPYDVVYTNFPGKIICEGEWQAAVRSGNALGRISLLSPVHLPMYADVMRQSFATVAREFNLTKENCPTHTSFITNERLEGKIKTGYYPFGYFTDRKLVGFVSLTDMGGGVYELNNISVLPEYRHFGYGKALLDFCKVKVREFGGNKITIGIIEENTVLKDWYAANWFIHTGTKRFEHLPFTAGYMEWRVTIWETDEERRARIYPIILSEYNPAWPDWFAEEKANLERLIGAENIARISHIGSTAVPGLTAKPTVDILLEINETAGIDKLVIALPAPEYVCLNEAALTIPVPPPYLMFLKGYLPNGFAEKLYHIHVRCLGDWDEPKFRDYLIVHPETAAEYAELKRRLFLDYEHDRDGYTEAKTDFIKSIVKKARKEAPV